LAFLAAQSGLERAREALAAADYHSAWEAIGAERDELARWQGRADILYGAGDPAGALEAARAGLALDPVNIGLLYHAARATVWMEDREGAVAYSGRLLRAADGVGDADSAERRGWQQAAADLVARSEALAARERELDRTLVRLRSASVAGVVLWLFLLWSVLRAQGRSSKPVS
jgi:hypothetical protein